MIGMESSTKIRRVPKRKREEFKVHKIDTADAVLAKDNNDYNEDENAEENQSDGSGIESNTDELSQDAKSISNAGWADVMQKILRTNKPKGKKTVVLAKAKRLSDIKVKEKKEDIPFEIEDSKDGVKRKLEGADIITEKHAAQVKQRIREKRLGIRIKPSITDREHERLLQKIATKGVVQLFNAVRQQQTDINRKLSQAGPLERKREQVLKNVDKNVFLDILMGGSKSIPVNNTVKPEKPVEQISDKNKDDKIWSVLRDDFIMGARLKDWDKKDAEEEDSSAPEDMDSDMD